MGCPGRTPAQAFHARPSPPAPCSPAAARSPAAAAAASRPSARHASRRSGCPWAARIGPVHPTAPLALHRRRPARAPAPGPRSASGAPVHGQGPVHGIVRHFVAHPLPSRVAHRPHDRLPAGVDGDVLDPDHLLALAPVLVERLHQGRVGAHELVRELQVLPPALEGLLLQHGAAEALHGGVVGGDHLRPQHPLQLVPGLHTRSWPTWRPGAASRAPPCRL